MCICTANHGIHAYVPVETFEVYQLVNHGKKCFSMDIFLLTKYKEYTENVHFNIDLIIIIACFLISIQSINVDFPAKTQLIWFPWMPLILFVFFFYFVPVDFKNHIVLLCGQTAASVTTTTKITLVFTIMQLPPEIMISLHFCKINLKMSYFTISMAVPLCNFLVKNF